MADLTISQTGFGDSTASRSCLPGMLIVISGPDKERCIIVDGPDVSIGTLADNTFKLTDKTVSRHHAKVVKHADQFFIHDLGSTNGTLVNGQRVSQSPIDFGAEIKLGYTQLSFVPCERRRPVAVPWHGVERRRRPAAAGQPVFWGGLRGCSQQMRSLFKVLDRIAPTDATIIFEGETGTGKELLARAVHDKSARAVGPFIVYDCRAIAVAQLEVELLGCEKGALPGAARHRPGVFEQARGGTLFLDEIGELDESVQPKLLRILENREVRRLGGDAGIPLDVRIIVSSALDLEELVAARRFRKDLFYRLAVHRLIIPPLRERPDDIACIAADLLEKLASEYRLPAPPRIAPETVDILRAYAWPGNVRELRNVLSRALSLGCRQLLRPENLLARTDESGNARETIEPLEKIAIEQTLRRRKSDLLKSAKELGISQGSLLDKIQKYGLS